MAIDLNKRREEAMNRRTNGGNGNENKDNDDKNNNRDKKEPPRNNRTPNKTPNGSNDIIMNIIGFFGTKKGIILIVSVAIVLLFMSMKPYAIVQSGEIAIKSTAGKYDNTPLQPGVHFFIPGIQRIIIVDTRVRIWNFTGIEDSTPRANQGILRSGAINVMDSRGLTVSIELTVQYQLNASTAPQTIATYGTEWESKVISPVVLEAVRTVVGNYPAEDLPNKRNEIAQQIESDIRQKLQSGNRPAVTLNSVQLREISLPQNIRMQIEKVQEARQRSEQARLEVEIARQEAEKRIALSKGEAESNIMRAKGVAESVIIEAKAQANANREIAQSLGENLLRLKHIETQGKFNEALKENRNAQIFLTPGGAVPNIWVDSKSKEFNSSISSGK